MRLTKRYIDKSGKNCVEPLVCDADIYQRLAEYEDDEEQGALIRLPCKVGTTVYVVFETKKGFKKHNYCYVEMPYSLDMICPNGYEIYLTLKEAEKRIKVLEGIQRIGELRKKIKGVKRK